MLDDDEMHDARDRMVDQVYHDMTLIRAVREYCGNFHEAFEVWLDNPDINAKRPPSPGEFDYIAFEHVWRERVQAQQKQAGIDALLRENARGAYEARKALQEQIELDAMFRRLYPDDPD